jgi:release factor glutamine methyltransferase
VMAAAAPGMSQPTDGPEEPSIEADCIPAMSDDVLLAGSSIAAARRALATTLLRHGIDNAELDARVLLGHALGLSHTDLALQGGRGITREEASAIGALAARRLAHEPVARIIGQREFWGLPITLGAGIFIPRPETETVVEAAVAALAGKNRAGRLRILDLATGSGALLLALLSELPDAVGIGTDTDAAALECARENANAHHLRAWFVACHYGAALRGPFDMIVANPPYIPRTEIATLAPEVREFDPLAALDGGPDGLDGYRAIARDVRRLLAPDGCIAVELGHRQAEAVAALFGAAGLATEPPRYDLSGKARALVARPLP